MAIVTELAAPSFLIAVPQLGDPNFNRGVVFLLEHSDEGTMGLVINRPTALGMEDFCKSQEMDFKGDGELLVYQGGPVQTERAFILHHSELGGPETEDVFEGVRLSYSLESLKILASEPPGRMRVYLGYAGWGPGQLAEEISQGAWLLAPALSGLVFEGQPEMIWEKALRELGIDPAQLMHSSTMH